MEEILQQLFTQMINSTQAASASASLLSQLVAKILGVIATYFVAVFLRRLAVQAMERAKIEPHIAHTLSRLLFYAVFGVGLLWALGGLGLSLLLLAVIFGFTARELLGDLGAGLLIGASRFINVGNWIQVDDFEGVVREIGWRGTRIETFDGRQILISNQHVVRSSVVNYSHSPVLRRSLFVSIDAQADLALAERVIIKALAAVPRVAETPAPDVLVVGMSALATDLEIRLWVKDAVNTLALTLGEAMRAIREALCRNDIALAMPEWFAVRERTTKFSGQ